MQDGMNTNKQMPDLACATFALQMLVSILAG